MKLCDKDCTPICDFCTHFITGNFNAEKGYCREWEMITNRDSGKHCDMFICSNVQPRSLIKIPIEIEDFIAKASVYLDKDFPLSDEIKEKTRQQLLNISKYLLNKYEGSTLNE